jgi:hypothetical protein
MRFTTQKGRRGALALACLALAATAVPGVTAAGAARVPGPLVKLEVAQRGITVYTTHRGVVLDPGVWVAALGSPLEFDVGRASYSRLLEITQIIHTPSGGIIRRPLPASVLAGWQGLRKFVVVTVRDSAGAVVDSKPVTFCPDNYDQERVSPASPASTPYPQFCTDNPFQKGMVWGVQRGWATDPTEFFPPFLTLPVGVDEVTETISPVYTRLFGIPARDATATVRVTVVRQGRRVAGSAGSGSWPTTRPARAAGPGPHPKVVRYLKEPPRDAMPDLVALPAWGIRVNHSSKRHADYLDFAATVWVGGNGPLDVEGFRVHGTPVMQAYQYFWRHGRVIGRARAGTMGFAPYNHWHFQQFARYALVNSARSLVLRSHKEGFCIAPTDPLDLLLRQAVWQPVNYELRGLCGLPSALWVTEILQVGWGDTYLQRVPGESFDITGVPNGTYYVEVIANPRHLLYETTARNDISYRKVILGGTPGHRTVTVPPWHGIDPEP